MAVNAEPARPFRADWRTGKVTSWLTTVDHKRIGILYILTSLVFFAIGGVLALAMRVQLATPDESVLTKGS
jgi:heme/copper-type cytochrome/quinol oxidase subunit 1